MRFWKHESTQFMQYDELNYYMQLKRWIWKYFQIDMNQHFLKKMKTQPFLNENVQ